MDRKQEIYDHIERMSDGGTSHGEIMRRFFGGKMGKCYINFPGFNIDICHGMTDEQMKELDELLGEKKIHLHATSLMVYLVDGCPIPQQKMAKNPSKGGYKEARWMPVLFYPGARCRKTDNAYRECPTKDEVVVGSSAKPTEEDA